MTNFSQQRTRMATAVLAVASFLMIALPARGQRIPKDPVTVGKSLGIIQWDFSGDGQFDTESLVRREQDGDVTAGEIRIPILENGANTVQEFGAGLGSWARFEESGTLLLQALHRNRIDGETPYRFLWVLAEFQLPARGSTERNPGEPLPGQAFLATFATIEDLLNKNPSLSASVNIRGWGNISVKVEKNE